MEFEETSHSTSLSTLEAECQVARSALCEVLGLKEDLKIIDPEMSRAKRNVWEDNQSLIAVVSKIDGGKYDARKHIAVRIFWLREVIASGAVSM